MQFSFRRSILVEFVTAMTSALSDNSLGPLSFWLKVACVSDDNHAVRASLMIIAGGFVILYLAGTDAVFSLIGERIATL